MKIGVLSDTHIKPPVNDLPPNVLQTFRAQNVGLILHAGDLVDTCVIDMLSSVAEVRAVAGNMDPLAIRMNLPAKRVEEIEGVRIGIIHGSGPPEQLGERLLRVFEGDSIRVLVHGHSHEPRNEEVRGVLLFNPGSPHGSRRGGPATVGVLTVEKGQVRGEIIELG